MEDLSDKNESRVSEFIDNPRKAVWKLSLPVMMGMAVYTFYNLTDMFFVGQLGGDALAALTFNMPVVFLAIGLLLAVGLRLNPREVPSPLINRVAPEFRSPRLLAQNLEFYVLLEPQGLTTSSFHVFLVL